MGAMTDPEAPTRYELEATLRSLRSQRAVIDHELYMIDCRIEETERALSPAAPAPDKDEAKCKRCNGTGGYCEACWANGMRPAPGHSLDELGTSHRNMPCPDYASAPSAAEREETPKCGTCGGSGRVMVPCPDGRDGCMVAHFGPALRGSRTARRCRGGEGDFTMSAPETFELLAPFDVDDGELAGVSAAEAFALGVEWAMVREGADREPGAFAVQVHATNEVRVLRLLRRQGRVARSRRHDGGWVWIAVEEAGRG